MKDYTFLKDKEFILNYKINDNKIIIKYASGKIYENFYTRELEKDILEKMKQQVLEAEVKIEERKTKNKFYDILNFFSTMIILIFMYNILELALLYELVIAAILTITTFTIPRGIRNSKIKDYEKNKLFVSNMNLFQEGIKENMGMYKNLDRKSKKYIKTILEEKEVLTKYNINDFKEPNVNSIDKISYESLKNIYNLLEENEKYSKYYDKEKSEPKKRVLSK